MKPEWADHDHGVFGARPPEMLKRFVQHALSRSMLWEH